MTGCASGGGNRGLRSRGCAAAPPAPRAGVPYWCLGNGSSVPKTTPDVYAPLPRCLEMGRATGPEVEGGAGGGGKPVAP